MKKIKIYAAVSLDAFTSRPDGDIDWVVEWVAEHRTPGGNDYGFGSFADTSACALINLPFYYLILSYEFCWPLAGMKSYVLANPDDEQPADKNVEVLPWDDKGSKSDEMIKKLLDEGDGDIWLVGDHSLIEYFAEQNLITELLIIILPVTLGDGIKLSFGGNGSKWELIESQIYENGIAQLKYSLKN